MWIFISLCLAAIPYITNGDVLTSQITGDRQTTILGHFNAARQAINTCSAPGKNGNLPSPARELPDLIWSTALAETARLKAADCRTAHNFLDGEEPDNWQDLVDATGDTPSEIITSSTFTSTTIDTLIDQQANNQYINNERNRYKYGPYGRNTYDGDYNCWKNDQWMTESATAGNCGHYTSIIWEGSTHVGCGYATGCNADGKKKVLVCHLQGFDAKFGSANSAGICPYAEGDYCSGHGQSCYNVQGATSTRDDSSLDGDYREVDKTEKWVNNVLIGSQQHCKPVYKNSANGKYLYYKDDAWMIGDFLLWEEDAACSIDGSVWDIATSTTSDCPWEISKTCSDPTPRPTPQPTTARPTNGGADADCMTVAHSSKTYLDGEYYVEGTYGGKPYYYCYDNNKYLYYHTAGYWMIGDDFSSRDALCSESGDVTDVGCSSWSVSATCSDSNPDPTPRPTPYPTPRPTTKPPTNGGADDDDDANCLSVAHSNKPELDGEYYVEGTHGGKDYYFCDDNNKYLYYHTAGYWMIGSDFSSRNALCRESGDVTDVGSSCSAWSVSATCGDSGGGGDGGDSSVDCVEISHSNRAEVNGVYIEDGTQADKPYYYCWDNDKYLYYDSRGYWMIGSDFNSRNTYCRESGDVTDISCSGWSVSTSCSALQANDASSSSSSSSSYVAVIAVVVILVVLVIVVGGAGFWLYRRNSLRGKVEFNDDIGIDDEEDDEDEKVDGDEETQEIELEFNAETKE